MATAVAVFLTSPWCVLLDTIRIKDRVSPNVHFLGGTMSYRLGAVVVAMGILVCSMGLKTALSSNHSGGTVITANGPDPLPLPPPPPKK